MIPLQTRGKPKNISRSIIGTIQVDNLDDSIFILDSKDINQRIVLSSEPSGLQHSIGVFNINTNHLTPGDIVILFPNGVLNTLFRVESEDNTIFMTNNCNQNCIMCSQPPKRKEDIEQLFEINSNLIDLIPLSTRQIGVSGGEPTLSGKYLFMLLVKLFTRIQQVNVTILTNAILLSDQSFFQNLEGLNKERILFSVPLYGDNQYTHDAIVRSKGAFYKTIKGIHNLFHYGFRVELRVIPQLKNILRLEKISHFIYKNLTFVEQVAFMGLENIGYARNNILEIWVPPEKLIGPLEKAVNFLKISGINCSLYNFQHCILSLPLREISQSTISDWKLEYLPICDLCNSKPSCGGIFNSSLEIMKEYINPL
jgi:His-Xaa-Ser system radical SAM maturase HxsC